MACYRVEQLPAVNHFLQICVKQCQELTLEAIKMQRPCSAALLAVFAIAYAVFVLRRESRKVRFPPPPLGHLTSGVYFWPVLSVEKRGKTGLFMRWRRDTRGQPGDTRRPALRASDPWHQSLPSWTLPEGRPLSRHNKIIVGATHCPRCHCHV